MARPRSRKPGRVDGVWVGLLVSGLIHAAGVGALIDAGGGADRSASAVDPDEPLPETPPDEDRMRLGIAESRQVTVNWIGYADPTPNRGLPSELEQAAMSVVPVGVPAENPSAVPSEASEPGEAQAEAEPQEPSVADSAESAAAQSQETVQTEPATAVEPGPEPVEPLMAAGPTPLGPELEVGLPEPVEVSAESGAASAKDESAEPTDAEPATENVDAEPALAEEPVKAETAPAEPARPSKPVSDAGGGPSGGDILPGVMSDKESSPTAKDPVVNIDDWGRPAAGEGIEVMPRRPVWGPTIAAVAMPRSPTVLVEFDRTGRVRKASFVKENGKLLSTGSAEVDRVLLNSVYNWRAKGAKIEALPAEGPGSRFRLRMHIRLRM